MPTVQISGPDCGPEECIERGPRGYHGRGGPTGATGPSGLTGPTGPTGAIGATGATGTGGAGGGAGTSGGSLLRFSAAFSAQIAGTTVNLPDTVNARFVSDVEYPVASTQVLESLAVRLLEVGSVAPGVDFTVPTGGTVTVQLWHNGAAVAGWLITYAAGQGGKRTLPAPPAETLAPGDTFYLQVVATGFDTGPVSGDIVVGATIGVRT